jgi:hypothetical protein
MDMLKIIKDARNMIAKPENWTQGVCARDIDGNEIGIDSPKAVCWCSLGALNEVYSDVTYDGWWALINFLNQEVGFGHVATFNDSHTHEEVLAMFDKAIAILESEWYDAI